MSSLSGARKPPGMSDAGVIDEQRHIASACRGRGDFVGLRDIEPDGLDITLLDRRGIAGAGVHLASAASEQFPDKSQADAAVGTGDEGNRVVDFHERLLNVRY